MDSSPPFICALYASSTAYSFGKGVFVSLSVTTQLGNGRDCSNTHGHQADAGVLLREVCTYR